MPKVLEQTLKGDRKSRIPVWFMRQAGRYLPEYRKIRQKYDHFLDFCFSPRSACEVTLQPLKRFDLDAAILFSDILVIPYALGQTVSFIKDKGPLLKNFNEIQLKYNPSKLSPVFEAIHLIKDQLPKNKSLIGFCGAPWTIATYMIEGQGSKTYQKTKSFAYLHAQEFSALLELLAQVSADYLIRQIEAGVDVVKIFDSWAGAVPAECFDEWVIQPTRIIVNEVKKIYPYIPIMGFPKGVGLFYQDYLKTGVDAITLDPSVPRLWALENLSQHVVLQGGLDPIVVLTRGKYLDQQIDTLLNTFTTVPYIFNLGHGFVPETPIENVEYIIHRIRSFEKSCEQLLSCSI